MEDASALVNKQYTDETTNDVEAQIAFVVIYPSKVQDPEDASKAIVFPAITDLYMTPELDVPIYCMQKRNSLSPLTMVPQIKVWQYAFLNNEQDEVTKLVRQRMSMDERRKFDEICGVMQSSDPWRRIKQHLKPEQ